MKRTIVIAAIAVAVTAVAITTGYWLGVHNTQGAAQKAEVAAAKTPERKILYYRNPMGLPDTSPVPRKDPMGMDYVPVYEGGEESGGSAPAPSAGGGAASGGAPQVRISIEKVQKLGVKTELATMRELNRTVRAAGRVEVDEQRIHDIAPKFEGWIEKLHVKAAGEPVRKGQALFDVYSPELVSAQREYAIAAQAVADLKDADSETRRSMQQLADASLLRLKNWDISEEQVKELARSETAKRSLTFNAFHTPVKGVVLEKKAFEGIRFMPGDVLYRIADLTSIWVIADVFEQDIGLVRAGSKARAKVDAYPDRIFDGVVSLVYPTLNAATRTASVRMEIPNPQNLLKPGMFANVEISVGSKGKVLTVPSSAVIDSGTRQTVLVQLAPGRFEPRIVKLGARSENYAEVLAGVSKGEQVVISANFLIDAESNLKAALSGLGEHVMSGGAPAAQKSPEAAYRAEQRAERGERAQLPRKPAAVGHLVQGTLNAINPDGTANITHGPVEALDWPGMTMDFILANPSLANNAKPGSAITFEIVERKPGEWVITKLKPMPSNAHEGH